MEQVRAFGNYLRNERELRQIPLAEVSFATKIPLRTLRSLEEGSWDDLPAQVFIRGFVRSYARHLGLPPEEACRRFDETIAEVKQIEDDLSTEPVGDAAAELTGRRRVNVALLFIIILIIATITLSLIWRRGASADTHAALQPTRGSSTAPVAVAQCSPPPAAGRFL